MANMKGKLIGLALVGAGVAGGAYLAPMVSPAAGDSAPSESVAPAAKATEATVPAPPVPTAATEVSAPEPAAAAPRISTPPAAPRTAKPRQPAPVADRGAATSRTAAARAPESPSPVAVKSEAPAAVLPETPNPVVEPPLPPPVKYDELTVAADSVLGVQLETRISSETASVEDRVRAKVTRDVLVDGKVAVPAGARLEGVVTAVTRGGKFKERPRIGVAFQTLVLPDNTRIAIATDTVFRDGDAPSGVNAKIGGGAVVGAILGGMLGGKKGAVLGGTAGAAGGTAAVAAGDRAEVVLTAGSSLTVRLTAPITVLVERHHELERFPTR
jgi:hypothetical protein